MSDEVELFYEVTLYNTTHDRPILQDHEITEFALGEILKNFFNMDLLSADTHISNVYGREGASAYLSSDVLEKPYALVARYKGRE